MCVVEPGTATHTHAGRAHCRTRDENTITDRDHDQTGVHAQHSTVQKHPGGAETHTRYHSPCIFVLPISKHHTPLRALLWDEGMEPQESGKVR